jgi:uncharacterized membrane protein YphA (DoxX/SURF4 family)
MITSTVHQSAKSTTLQSIWLTLKLTFGVVPIVAGADKFFNLLTDWTQYVSPQIAHVLPFDTGTFMMIVGVIEIIAGVIVLLKTELGAYIVAAWLLCISLSLIVSLSYLDVAVRDLVMAIGAVTLAQLTKLKED